MIQEALVVSSALVCGVSVGLVIHEASHGMVLRIAGVEYDVTFFPGRHDSLLGRLASVPWAVVHPHPTGRESPWTLRIAALAPLLLTVPVLGLALVGFVPSGEAPFRSALVLGWLACALPSPQDFSVSFYAHRLLADARDGPPGEASDRAVAPAGD